MDRYVARGYQLEMLEQSLKENIILVVCRIHNQPYCRFTPLTKQMDTGSGKTHV
ncbi:uncharacterized protein ASPGLDRAFT_43420 [Aspergillus glaucus CBS 516.65]|uniref:Uncharacterized protein n=1 Tax=Aspergillus glaucus CBS 516.65 TaxID=1160497 RepID=A0A1L9VSR2_ASPGL|nr:hypothetical protein ASPGLDRAFT_43420 [Aspergillus glaucus CBS 516.65]OJJ86947.1 hypothetical protein ASPGLDRAFT_43420 [Aspergillus glaucus CBS 516.65]